MRAELVLDPLVCRTLCLDTAGRIVAPDDASRAGLRILSGDTGIELTVSKVAVACINALHLITVAHSRGLVTTAAFEDELRSLLAAIDRLIV
jgi:hypothetical protein